MCVEACAPIQAGAQRTPQLLVGSSRERGWAVGTRELSFVL